MTSRWVWPCPCGRAPRALPGKTRLICQGGLRAPPDRVNFSAAARALSDYVDALAANEQEKIKLYIDVQDPHVNGGHILSVWEHYTDTGAREYHIDTGVVLSLQLLARSLHYFTLDGIQRFDGVVKADGHYIPLGLEAIDQYNAVLDLAVGDVDLSSLKEKRIVIELLEKCLPPPRPYSTL